jgi:hypothetical protein
MWFQSESIDSLFELSFFVLHVEVRTGYTNHKLLPITRSTRWAS